MFSHHNILKKSKCTWEAAIAKGVGKWLVPMQAGISTAGGGGISPDVRKHTGCQLFHPHCSQHPSIPSLPIKPSNQESSSHLPVSSTVWRHKPRGKRIQSSTAYALITIPSETQDMDPFSGNGFHPELQTCSETRFSSCSFWDNYLGELAVNSPNVLLPCNKELPTPRVSAFPVQCPLQEWHGYFTQCPPQSDSRTALLRSGF